MEKLAKKLGIESLSRGMASEIAQGLNEQVEAFRSRSLADSRCPALWVDALYEKARVDGKTVRVAVMVIMGVNEQGRRGAPLPAERSKRSSYNGEGRRENRRVKFKSLALTRGKAKIKSPAHGILSFFIARGGRWEGYYARGGFQALTLSVRSVVPT